MSIALEDRIRLPALGLIYRRSCLLELLEKLVASRKRVITVYAPSGYGKSTLLIDFAQTTNLPVCWCSLAATDRDPTTFFTLLAYSLIERFHEIEATRLLDFVAAGDTQATIRYLAELMGSLTPFIIIIDNYQQAIHPGLALSVNKLWQRLPETTSVILASRSYSPQNQSQLVTLPLGECCPALSEQELRFGPKEIQRLMHKRFGRHIDRYEAAEIAQATDGNIAQILLAGYVMNTNRSMNWLRQQFDQGRAALYRYLAEEIFGRQSPQLQRFMLHTSILPYISVNLCNEVLTIDDAQRYIDELAHQDLFVVQTGEGLKYSELFSEFLRSELASNERLYHQISLKTAEVLATHSQFVESVQFYLPAQAWSEAIPLLEEKGKHLYETGHALTLHQWLTKIPQSQLEQHPNLLLLQGQILNDDLGQSTQAITLFRRAEARFRQQNNLIGAAQAKVWISSSTRSRGKVETCLDLAWEGLTQLETLGAGKALVAWARKNYGLAHWMAGNVDKALIELRYALRIFEEMADSYRVGLCHREIGACLNRQGNIVGAEHHYKRAIQIWESLGNANNLAGTLTKLGEMLRAAGHYDEALQQFNDSLEIGLRIGAAHRIAVAKSGIGDTLLEAGKYEQAIEVYIESTDYARQAEIKSLEIYNQVRLGECFYHQHNLTKALVMSNEAKALALEMGLTYERGLACALQGRIYLRQAMYAASLELFKEALGCFAENDVLEQAKVKLWWAYSLFLDFRVSAAFEQLKEALRLVLSIGELKAGLTQAVRETQQLLFHFVHWINTPSGLQESILMLLQQSRDFVDISAPSLQLFTFGIPILIVGGERKQFIQRGRASKLPEFLAYLLLEGRVGGCRWHEVTTAIWPELEPDRASTIFHQNIRRLRDSFFMAPDYIIVRDDYYQINPYYYEWCDALAFEKLFERISSSSPQEALPLQLELIDLYQGEFLTGFELGDWGIIYRTRCENRFLYSVKMAGKQLLKNGSAWKALGVLQKGLDQNYFQEDLHYHLLKAYAQLGLYGELHTHYQILDEIFKTEMGISPSPMVKELYQGLTTKRD